MKKNIKKTDFNHFIYNTINYSYQKFVVRRFNIFNQNIDLIILFYKYIFILFWKTLIVIFIIINYDAKRKEQKEKNKFNFFNDLCS